MSKHYNQYKKIKKGTVKVRKPISKSRRAPPKDWGDHRKKQQKNKIYDT